jgi:hypothetical protein
VEIFVTICHDQQTSQSTLLLKKRKEMREVDEALAKTKRDYITKMNECEERRRAFEEKQAKMREQVLKFEKFIQENDAKRKRADTKEKQERKQYDDKCIELTKLNKDIDKLLSEKMVSQLTLGTYSPAPHDGFIVCSAYSLSTS